MFTLTDCLAMIVVLALGGFALAAVDRASDLPCIKIAAAIAIAGDCR